MKKPLSLLALPHTFFLGSALFLSGCAEERQELDGYVAAFDASKFGAAQDSCQQGEETKCSTTLEQSSGVLSCYHGIKVCVEENQWSACGDGRITTQIDPTFYLRNGDIRQQTPGQSFQAEASVACDALNPCDPNCQYWAEDDEITNETEPGSDGTPAGPLEDWSTTTEVCDHQLCEEGVALSRSCHPCVETICNSGGVGLADCCDGGSANSWDAACVDAVYTYCTDDAPPEGPQICAYALMADQEVDLDFKNIIPGAIGGRQGVKFNSAFKGASILISEANITLTDSGNYGVVYSEGSVTLRNNSTVEQLFAKGNVNTLGSSRVGLNGLFTYGSLQPNHQLIVEGPITARYNCNLGNSNLGRIEGTMNCGGNLTTKNNLSFLAGVTHYIGGNAVFNGAARHSINLHVGGGFTINDNQGALTGNLWAGGNIVFKDANNTVNNLQAGGNVSCNRTSQGATGAAVLGGTASGLCAFGSLAENQSSPPLEAPIAPTIPSFPAPPIAFPSVDAYRRDTSQVCALANSAANKTNTEGLYPGIYRDVNPGWGKSITLEEPGSYVFRNYSSSNSVPLKFRGDGPWDITVCQKFHLVSGAKMQYVSGGQVDGSKVIIYSAAVRSGSCSTNGAGGNCCIQSDNASQLSGFLIAPDCDISIGNGTTARAAAWGNNVFTGSNFESPPGPDACAASNLLGQISCRTSESGPLVPLYLNHLKFPVAPP